MFYVNDEPEGKFHNTETIKLYCIVLYKRLVVVFQSGQDTLSAAWNLIIFKITPVSASDVLCEIETYEMNVCSFFF